VSPTALAFVALLLAAGSAARWFQLALQVRLPQRRTTFLLVWAASALLGAFALSQGPGWVGGIAAGIALFIGAFLLGTSAIGPQQVAPDAIRVGESLRAFSAPDENGERFEIASTAGRPVLLKFFRGHW
jgi:hypothetical protein